MKKRTLLIIVAVIPLIFFLDNCETPVGLEDVSGIEGTIIFNGSWPSGITAAAPVVFDSTFGTLIALGDPVIRDTTDEVFSEYSYFIQLSPGDYCLITLGLSGIEPAYFAANVETYMEDANNGGILPLEFLENPLDTIESNWEPFTVTEKEITTFDKEVNFTGIQGNIFFDVDEWPEDITAVTTVVFDKKYPVGEMLAYGMPIESGVSSSYYFLQLNSGEYYKTIFGLQDVEPAFFVANLDSFLEMSSKPFVDLLYDGYFDVSWRPDTVITGEIITINDTIIFD